MPLIFLSYSHDSDEHSERVRALAERLREIDDLTVRIDRDCWPGGPDEGWDQWCERQVREADRVLVVCTETYMRRYNGDDDDADRGHGTVAEGRAIRQYLYKNKGVNQRFRVVLFDDADVGHIPLQLEPYHRFLVTNDDAFQELVAWLTGVAAADADDDADGFAWPDPDHDHPRTLADRKDESTMLRDALSGRWPKRIFLFEGATNTGKTALLGEIAAYAEHVGIGWARVDLKGTPPLDDVFDTLKLDLGRDVLPETHRAAGARPSTEVLADLQNMTAPVLLIFDTWEQASEECRRWIEGRLLSRADRMPGLVVIIGGQTLPEHGKYPWHNLVQVSQMKPIDRPEDWIEYSAIAWKDADVPPEHVEAFINGTNGNPGLIRFLLENTINRPRPDKG